ncbi:MAG: hypothetical protein GEV07_19965 [Streptosporangiales bacterium]|nr:hypothetical protein [Streptosporangiales bacterium]
MTWPVMVCDGGQRREVHTLLELEALLAAIAAVGPPSWVQITSSDGTHVLGVALGRGDVSALTFSDRDTATTLASTATVPMLGGYDFDDAGTPRPVHHDDAISVQTAHWAITEFVQTGQRPRCVDWHPAENPAWPS